MTLSKQDAMEHCIAKGKEFISCFDEFYNETNRPTLYRLIDEMTNIFENIKSIRLKHNDKPILNRNLWEWFFSAGANPEDFMKSPTDEEIYKYDSFVSLIIRNKDIKEECQALFRSKHLVEIPKEDNDFLLDVYKDMSTNGISINQLQKDFSIGFNRAVKIIDFFENIGVISKKEGTNPRELLIKDESKVKELIIENNK